MEISQWLAPLLCALLCSSNFLKFTHSADSLSPNESLTDGQILVSSGQMFEFGFFSPGNSRNSFLGIWYKATPDIVIWVANRNDPVLDRQGVLTITSNGTLVLMNKAQHAVWQSNSSGSAVSPVLRLLDVGNLVVIDRSNEASQSYLWQSFDYPTDTRTPGIKLVDDPDSGIERYLVSWKSSDDPSPGDYSYRIENRGVPQLVVYKGMNKIYRSGMWNGLYFNGRPSLTYPIYNPDMVFNNGRLISVTERYNKSLIARIVVNSTGLLEKYHMNEERNKWRLALALPDDICDNYGTCGPNSICKVNKAPPCECLVGFEPKSPVNWEMQEQSSGCKRKKAIDCQNGDDFLKITGVKFPDMLRYQVNASAGPSECRSKCLKSCSCTAYANTDVSGGGRVCLMWFGDLVDVRQIPEGNDKDFLYLRVPLSEIKEYDSSSNKKSRSTKTIWIVTALGVLISIFIWGGILLMIRRRRAMKLKENLDLPVFDFATIAAATNNFSSDNLIGEGGFGPVYKGSLSDEQLMAVKRLSKTSGQGLDEFKNEVSLIAKLQHRNLVRLLGCCIKGAERMLIYEYMQHKSLDNFIFDQNRSSLLDWPKRFDIIMGVARGLLYLHQDSRLKIIHRDLKTSNILLDSELMPKISDFGLARIVGGDQTITRTKRVIGTYGYMAPEYAIDGKFSVKSDVFSMGVVLLEIVSGKRNRGFKHPDHHHSLLGHAWMLWNQEMPLDLMDSCLHESFVENQVKRCIQVGLLCVQKLAEDRPEMSSVLFMLGNEEAVLSEPKEPGFFMERSCMDAVSSEEYSSIDSRTITIIEAR